jgi:tetratricopeptide (TPR) repeat protein
MQPCPHAETLSAFVDGRLAATPRSDLEGHFDDCGGCRQLLAQALSRVSVADRPPEQAYATLATTPLRGFGLARAVGERFGRYVILAGAGAGGMGAVYAAFDTALERKVALKFLARAGSDASLGLLLTEASMMAKLNHPNVVTVYDAGVIDETPFLAMELVEGQTLSAWVETPRSLREIVTVMAGVARGLAAAHACGIVHRDVKPGNILVDGDRALVTDFGLSVHQHAREDGVTGTPGYMAPEQWRSEPVDPRTDVFAFCVTLYKVLYGMLPFEGEDLAELRQAVLAGKVSPPPTTKKIPLRLQRIALSGLTVDPNDRPSELGAIAEALLADPARTRRRRAAMAIGGLAIAGAFAGGLYLTGSPERRCHAGESAIEASYGGKQRAAIRARYEAAGLADAFAALDGRLVTYVRGWRAMHAEACAATFGARRESETMLDLRMTCLDERRASVTALGDVLARAAPAGLANAAGAVLPGLSGCAAAAQAGTLPLPKEGTARAEVAAVRKQVAEARATAITGDYETASKTAAGALAAARKVGYEPALAAALVQAARIEGLRGNGEQFTTAAGDGGNVVERLYQEALSVAERGRADRERASAAVDLVMEYADSDRFREAELWSELASALLARIGNPADEQASLALNLGWLQFRRGDKTAALASYDRALELWHRVPNVDEVAISPATAARCGLLDTSKQRLDCSLKAAELARRAFGPRHPHLAIIYDDIADELQDDPRTRAEACDYMARGLAIKRAALAPRHTHIINSLLDLGQCYLGLGKQAEAKQMLEESLTLVVRPSSLRAQARQNYASYLWEIGDLPGAIHHQRLAAEDRLAIFGKTHERTLRARRNLAEQLRAHGEHAAALIETDAILASCVGLPAPPPYLWRVHLARGAALLDLGRAREAVAALATASSFKDAAEAEILVVRGLAHERLHERAQARADFERALSLRPAQEAESEDRAEAAYHVARTTAGATGLPSARSCALAQEAADRYRKTSKAYINEQRRSESLWLALKRRGC